MAQKKWCRIFLSITRGIQDAYSKGEFLEYEEVYKDRFYGTLKSQVDAQLERGENVVCDVDVLGGQNIKHITGTRL